MILFLLLLLLISLRRTESLYDTIKGDLEVHPTETKDDKAIEWALANLAKHLNSTVTVDHIENEIGKKVHELVERVEITDAALKQDLNQLKLDFIRTRQSIFEMVETMKVNVIDDMANFADKFKYSILEVVEASKPIQESYHKNMKEKFENIFDAIGGSSYAIAVSFFFFFQLMMILGIFNFSKVYRLLNLLL